MVSYIMFNIHNLAISFFRRRRNRRRTNEKFCAVIKADQNMPCSPWGYHCNYGLSCKKLPGDNSRVSLQQLFTKGNRQQRGGGGGRRNRGGNGGRPSCGTKRCKRFSRCRRRCRQQRANGGGGGGQPNRAQLGGRRRSKRQADQDNPGDDDYGYSMEDYPNQDTKPFNIDDLFGFKLHQDVKKWLENHFRKNRCVKLRLATRCQRRPQGGLQGSTNGAIGTNGTTNGTINGTTNRGIIGTNPNLQSSRLNGQNGGQNGGRPRCGTQQCRQRPLCRRRCQRQQGRSQGR